MHQRLKKYLKCAGFDRPQRGLRLFAIAAVIYAGTGFIIIPWALEKIAVPLLTAGTGVHVGLHSVSLNPFLLKVGIQGLEMGLEDSVPTLKAGEIEADFGLLNTLVRLRPSLDAIRLVDPEIGLRASKDGSNLDEIIRRLSPPETAPTEPVETNLPAFVLSNLLIAHGRLGYSAPERGINLDLGDLNIDLHDIDTGSDRDGHFNISTMLNDHALLMVKGGLQILPAEYRIAVEMTGLDLAWVQSAFPTLYPFAGIKGGLDLSTNVHMLRNVSDNVAIENLQLNLKDVNLTSKVDGMASVNLGHFGLSGGTLNSATHEICLDTVEIKDTGVISALDTLGRPGWESLLPPPAASDTTKSESQPTDSPWKLSLRQVQLKNLTLGSEAYSEDRPGLRVGGFEISAVTADPAQRSAGIGSVHLVDTRLLMANDNKDLVPLKGFMPAKGELPVKPSKPVQSEKAWSVRMEGFDVDNLAIGFSDSGVTSVAPIEITQIKGHIGAFHTDEAKPTPLSLQANVTSGGRFSLEGTVNVAEQTALGEVIVTNVDLTPVAPFLEGSIAIDKTSGLVSSHLTVDASFKDEKPKVRIKGGLEINRFEVTQAPDHRKLLLWEELALEGIEGSMIPPRLKIKELRLKDPVAVLDIRKDKSSNIGDLILPSKDAKVIPEPTPEPEVISEDSPKLRIHRITIDRGKLDYSDQSLILPFKTEIVELKGAITGLTLHPKANAALDLHGRIAPYGEAEITGQLRPQDPTSSMDIALHLENVVLSSLSPYSATFAGRRIESGKLDLNTQYRMENHQLTSENKILLRKLRLGDRVESPEAVSLPLDLAVSLLTDADGDINLSLPIEGRTDSPEFSYGGVILDALKTVLGKIVLSPFTVMAGALDLHSDDLDAFAFDLGGTFLTPPEKEKVLQLVEALKRKPELKLKLSGVYDPEADLMSLKTLWLRRVIAERLGEQLGKDDVAAPVSATDPATQFALDDLAVSSSLMDETVNAYVAEFGRLPDRVGRLTKMFGKRSQTPEFYEKLLKNLEAHAPIGLNELKKLGQQRAETVKSALLGAGAEPLKGRISISDVQTNHSEDSHHIRMPLSVEME